MKPFFDRAATAVEGGRRLLAAQVWILVLALILAGCGNTPPSPEDTGTEPISAVETTPTETTPPETTPPDGNPGDVTCKGTYTAQDAQVRAAADTIVATAADAQLTVGQLQIYYWLEVADYRLTQNEAMPDFAKPLDTQLCQIDETAVTWQQFFLQRALNSWHAQQALVLESEAEELPTEEAYQPNLENHEKYMTGMPATKVLYGYNKIFRPNELHQAYLDGIPAMLEQLSSDKGYESVSALVSDLAGAGADEKALEHYVQLYNRGYMYYTTLSYYAEPEQEAVEAYFAEHQGEYTAAGISQDGGKYVDMRHILLIPEGASVAQDGTVTCSQEAWDACLAEAQDMLKKWSKDWRCSESTFAELANNQSKDPGSRLNGGLYRNLRAGQLTRELDAWCFDEARQVGDAEIIKTDCGYHIVYFCGSREISDAQAQTDLTARMLRDLIGAAKENYPMTVDYGAIELGVAGNPEGMVTSEELLYPDIAHERYPVVPLYLQQDYPETMYGKFKITSHGCGITTMAMLASYMADEELTPPMMCERYDRYCYVTGTDGRLFVETPPEMGFYLEEQVFDWRRAKEALEEGHIVVVVQHKGYWTRGGHYLVLEKMHADDMVQVRDSNIFNYGKLQRHMGDLFPWSTITPAGMSYWIYENKITRIPACVRCGDAAGEGVPTALFTEDYFCAKCDEALLRRNTYIAGMYA